MQNTPVKWMSIVFTFVSLPLISFYEQHLGVLLILSGRQGALALLVMQLWKMKLLWWNLVI